MAVAVRKRRSYGCIASYPVGVLAVMLTLGCTETSPGDKSAASDPLMPVLVEVAAPDCCVEAVTRETAKQIEALLDDGERATMRRFATLPLISVSVDAETLAAILAIPTVSSVSRDGEMQFVPQDKDSQQ